MSQIIKTILLVDDNEDLKTVLSYQLEARGYRVTTASDGLQIVKKCKADKPDLVIMDIMMPGKDGTEAAAELKLDQETQNIPVIFLTSLVHGENSFRSQDAKDRYSLPKSIDMEKLFYEIELALTRNS